MTNPEFQVPSFYELRVGSWNSQGGSTPARQTLIDDLCDSRGLDVICLQDVRLQVPAIQSERYHWLTSFTGNGEEKMLSDQENPQELPC